MECLSLLQEPFQPTTLDTELFELVEGTALVYLGIMGELGAFNERKDDCVL
jgi:hypothetical protein